MIATQNSIDMKNNAQVTGGLASNGNITLKNNANVCGPITAGVGKTYSYGNNTTVCPGYSTAPATTPFVFQPVDQGTTRTTNDNIRITRAISGSSTTPKDTCSGCNKITLDSNRVLTINSGGTLTLTGDNYNFCKLNLNGGDLQIPVRTTTMKIFIDTPENCSAVGSTAGSVYFKSGSEFVNLASNPALVALFVSGSATKATTVELSSNDSNGSSDVSLAIYAPNSTVDYDEQPQVHRRAGEQVADAQEQLPSSRTTVASPVSPAAATAASIRATTTRNARRLRPRARRAPAARSPAVS